MLNDNIHIVFYKEETILSVFTLSKGNHYIHFCKHPIRYHFLCIYTYGSVVLNQVGPQHTPTPVAI